MMWPPSSYITETRLPMAARPERRTTLRKRIGVVFLALLMFAAVEVVALASLYRKQLETRDRVALTTGPLAAAAVEVLAALVDQETGLRGFALSGNPAFLEPYKRGQMNEVTATATLKNLVLRVPSAQPAAGNFERATQAWHQAAEQGLEVATTQDPVRGAEALLRSNTLFNDVRLTLASLSEAIDITSVRALEATTTATRRVIILGASLIAGLLLAGELLWLGLRRWVIDPIDRLGRDVQRVAEGNPDHLISATGPAEIAVLGADVEAMRSRIVADLKELTSAQAELRRSNSELEQFAYVASHDLQEPLRKVASFCQLLDQRYGDVLDDRGKQYLDFAVDGATRMQGLITGLLAFSRVGRTTERFTLINTHQIALEAVDLFHPRIEEVEAVVSVSDLPEVSGDKALLAAVFQNLIGNALKFRSAERQPSITLDAVDQGDAWLFTCSDNGIGLDPRFAERVFTIFQRLHARDEYEGTGIGLALCRKIVEFHGGRIWIDAAASGGTAVRWTLPKGTRSPLSRTE